MVQHEAGPGIWVLMCRRCPGDGPSGGGRAGSALLRGSFSEQRGAGNDLKGSDQQVDSLLLPVLARSPACGQRSLCAEHFHQPLPEFLRRLRADAGNDLAVYDDIFLGEYGPL